MLSGATYTRAVPVLAALVLTSGCGGSDGGETLHPDGLSAPPTAQADGAIDAGIGSDATPMDAGSPPDASADGAADAALDEPEMCPATPLTSCPEGSPGYAAIKPLVEAKCVTCHSPRWTGPWPLDTVGHLRDWFDDVRVNLINCTMPPRDSGVKLTNAERRTLMQWVRCGMPD